MPFKKGQSGNPGGRERGSENLTTRDVREAIALIARENIEAVSEKLRAVLMQDPARGIDLYLRLIEYHIPRLARREHTGRDGGPVRLCELSDAELLEIASQVNP